MDSVLSNASDNVFQKPLDEVHFGVKNDRARDIFTKMKPLLSCKNLNLKRDEERLNMSLETEINAAFSKTLPSENGGTERTVSHKIRNNCHDGANIRNR